MDIFILDILKSCLRSHVEFICMKDECEGRDVCVRAHWHSLLGHLGKITAFIIVMNITCIIIIIIIIT